MLIKYGLELETDERKPRLVEETAFPYEELQLDMPEKIVDMLNTCFNLKNKAEEYVYVVGFDTAMKPLGIFEISHGSVAESYVSPREIFLRLLLCGAACFVVAHNHPSGRLEASTADMNIKERLKSAGDMMNIRLMDFIIIGDGYYSLKQEGAL